MDSITEPNKIFQIDISKFPDGGWGAVMCYLPTQEMKGIISYKPRALFRAVIDEVLAKEKESRLFPLPISEQNLIIDPSANGNGHIDVPISNRID